MGARALGDQLRSGQTFLELDEARVISRQYGSFQGPPRSFARAVLNTMVGSNGIYDPSTGTGASNVTNRATVYPYVGAFSHWAGCIMEFAISATQAAAALIPGDFVIYPGSLNAGGLTSLQYEAVNLMVPADGAFHRIVMFAVGSPSPTFWQPDWAIGSGAAAAGFRFDSNAYAGPVYTIRIRPLVHSEPEYAVLYDLLQEWAEEGRTC